MATKFIQSLFFLSICISINGMDHHKQRDNVRALLKDNENNWYLSAIGATPKNNRPAIAPLPPLPHTIIKNRQTKEILTRYKKIEPRIPADLSILKQPTALAYASII